MSSRARYALVWWCMLGFGLLLAFYGIELMEMAG